MTEEILEGNKLIVTFMGWELVNLNDEPEDPDFDCWVFKNKLTGAMDSGIDAQFYDKDSTLPYNENWNLLMPAVYKCCREMSNAGVKGRGQWTPEHGYISDLWHMKLNSPIESVWMEVVKYIKNKK